jgi:hypothetical protein
MTRRPFRALQFGLRTATVVLSLIAVALAYHTNYLHRERAARAMIVRLGGRFVVRDPGIIIHEENGTIRDLRTWKQRLRATLQPMLPLEILEVRLGGPRPPQPPRSLDGRGISRSWHAALDPTNKIPVRFPEWEAKVAATDADVAQLRGLPIVEYLDLSYTQVTDAIVDDLCSLPRLRIVRLERTLMTSHGLDELRRRLPECLVSLTDSPPPPTP